MSDCHSLWDPHPEDKSLLTPIPALAEAGMGRSHSTSAKETTVPFQRPTTLSVNSWNEHVITADKLQCTVHPSETAASRDP